MTKFYGDNPWVREHVLEQLPQQFANTIALLSEPKDLNDALLEMKNLVGHAHAFWLKRGGADVDMQNTAYKVQPRNHRGQIHQEVAERGSVEAFLVSTKRGIFVAAKITILPIALRPMSWALTIQRRDLTLQRATSWPGTSA